MCAILNAVHAHVVPQGKAIVEVGRDTLVMTPDGVVTRHQTEADGVAHATKWFRRTARGAFSLSIGTIEIRKQAHN